MHRLRLSTWLIAGNVGVLLLAVVVVAIVAVRLLQQLADEQALARVNQAATIAEQQVLGAHDTLATTAALLSERPTLRRLLQQNDTPALSAFIDQFAQTSQLDAIFVIRNGSVIASSGSVDAQFAQAGSGHDIVQGGERDVLLRAAADVEGVGGATVIAIRRLDQAFADELSAELGLPVTIAAQPAAPQTGSAAPGQVIAERVAARGAYVAVAPLHNAAGSAVGAIEVALPGANVAQGVQQLVWTLLLLALAVALVAGVLSLGMGRWLGDPLHRLTRAAARIGRGDLQTPIPRAPGAEIGLLAATLEDMRWRLQSLTGDLKRQQAEAEAIVTGIIEGVFSVDRERRIRFLNPQAAVMLGTTAENAIGQFCGDVLHPLTPDRERPCATQCPIVHARFRGGARATEHLRLPDGQRRTVVITSAPDVDGQQVQVMRDETEIEATRRLRDAILANISHEFRTPLSAQLASIELLLDQLLDLSVEQIGQLVRSQQRGTLRLTHLIDNLLESARIEAGHDGIRRQPVALDEVVENAIELVRPLLDQRRQRIAIDLPFPLPTVDGDATRLTQVFVNLLGNANKWAPADSTIAIGGAVGEAEVALWVEDGGPGLQPGWEANLFDRFVRGAQDEPEQSGVGLGLWLVKSIAERHGGRVEAQRIADRTRMTVVLPQRMAYETVDR
jgi:signal transduction histidine kinase